MGFNSIINASLLGLVVLAAGVPLPVLAMAEKAVAEAKLTVVENATIAAAIKLPERALGKVDAPVTIIEYASLTCGHCAQFHTETLPQLKEKFIDTGKVRLVFRDYPLDGIALRAAAVARCMPESSYFGYLSTLFKNQEQWRSAEDVTKPLVQLARLGGLSGEDAEACVASEPLMDAIAAARLQADKDYQIQSTPSFVFNGGAAKLLGAQPISVFAETIEKLLPKTKSEPKN
jgi:protein-disulfide isomerase